MKKNKKVVFTVLLYSMFFFFAGYLYIFQYDKELKTEKYNALANEMQELAASVIEKNKKRMHLSLFHSL